MNKKSTNLYEQRNQSFPRGRRKEAQKKNANDTVSPMWYIFYNAMGWSAADARKPAYYVAQKRRRTLDKNHPAW